MTYLCQLHVVESFEELEGKDFPHNGGKRHLLFPMLFDDEVETTGHLLHDDGEIAFIVDDLEEVLPHVDNVAMLQAGKNAELPIFVSFIL